MPSPEKTPDSIYKLMLKAWEHDPDKRPHFDEIHKDLTRIYKIL